MEPQIGKRKNLIESLIWILTVALLSSFSIFYSENFGRYIFIGVTVLMVLLSAADNDGKIYLHFGMFQLMTGVFAAFVFFSAVWAWNSGDAIQKGSTLTQIIICMTVFYSYFLRKGDVDSLISAVMWAGYVVTFYITFTTGFSQIIAGIDSGSRLDTEVDNINTLGMLSATSIVITIYYFVFKKSKNIPMMISAVFGVVMTAASGSRKALVMLILGALLVFLFKYVSNDFFISVIKIVIFAVVAFFVIRWLLSLPIFSVVEERMQTMINSFLDNGGKVDGSTRLREQFRILGMNQFRKTPILGIGMGNSHLLASLYLGKDTYLHNNFVELLSCGGIIGFTIYYSIYLYCFVKLFKVRNSSPCVKMLLILMLLLLIMDYGMVSYNSKAQYFYFMMFFIAAKVYDKNEENTNESEKVS